MGPPVASAGRTTDACKLSTRAAVMVMNMTMSILQPRLMHRPILQPRLIHRLKHGLAHRLGAKERKVPKVRKTTRRRRKPNVTKYGYGASIFQIIVSVNLNFVT